jgi:hypothetical protein
MSSVLWGLLGGVVAWVSTTIIGTPLFRFFNLRAEAAKVLALFEGCIDPSNPDADIMTDKWLARRRQAYQACGADLIAFAASNSLLLHWHHRLSPRRLRIFPRSAGQALMTLADAKPGTQASHEFHNTVLSALKFRPWPVKPEESGFRRTRCG